MDKEDNWEENPASPDGGPPIIDDERPQDVPEAIQDVASQVPSAARIAEAPEPPEPGDVLMAVEPPLESFSAHGVTLTQEPIAVPRDKLATMRRVASDAGVAILEGTAE